MDPDAGGNVDEDARTECVSSEGETERAPREGKPSRGVSADSEQVGPGLFVRFVDDVPLLSTSGAAGADAGDDGCEQDQSVQKRAKSHLLVISVL